MHLQTKIFNQIELSHLNGKNTIPAPDADLIHLNFLVIQIVSYFLPMRISIWKSRNGLSDRGKGPRF